jgi:hypothetical protein
VCDLETSRICTPYIYDISHLRINILPSSYVSFKRMFPKTFATDIPFHIPLLSSLVKYNTRNTQPWTWNVSEGVFYDKTDADRRYPASNAIGKRWHIHAWLELKINLFFSLFISNDSCCYVHCCVTSLSIFMTSLLHTHSFSAVESIVSLDTEGSETECSMFTFLRTTVNCSNKSTNQMQQFFQFITWRLFTAQHVSGALKPIIRSSTTAVAASGFTFRAWW